jgi:hypothetical protein
MVIQGITVDYTNNLLTCQLCNKHAPSHGGMLQMDKCGHIYHIQCIIHAIDEKHDNDVNVMQCPCCQHKFQDTRLTLAIAYKRQDTQLFTNTLLH